MEIEKIMQSTPETIEQLHRSIDTMVGNMAKLEHSNMDLREVLRFYADEKTWMPFMDENLGMTSEASGDKGYKARQVLRHV